MTTPERAWPVQPANFLMLVPLQQPTANVVLVIQGQTHARNAQKEHTKPSRAQLSAKYVQKALRTICLLRRVSVRQALNLMV